MGKRKPGLFGALTLGLALLIAASALTANNNAATDNRITVRASID